MKIIKATPKEYEQMAKTLAQAFMNDPVINYILKPNIRKDQALQDMFLMIMRFMKERDELYFTENMEGVALWDPPDRWGLTFFQELSMVPTLFRICGLSRLGRFNSVMTATKKVHPSASHVYLFAIGVMPDLFGKGIGSQLMRHMLDRCDTEKVPAYLENTNEINTQFYLNHGFKITGEIQVSSEAPKILLMWRDPK